MTKEEIKQALLDYGWDAAERRRIAEILRAVETDEECDRAARDYDLLRSALARPEIEDMPPTGWDEFEDRLTETALSQRSISWWKYTAIAAGLLLALVLYRDARQMDQSGTTRPTGAALAGMGFTVGEISDNAGAFAQVAEVFDRRASWLLLSDEASDVGLVADPQAPASRVLMFRFTVTHGGKTISNADLIIVPGQTADVTVPCSSERQIRYQVATTGESPTRVSLWVELQRDGRAGETLASVATDLAVHPGETLSAGQMATSSGEYSVHLSFSETHSNGAKS